MTKQHPSIRIVVVQSLSGFRLFVTPWTVAHEAPLSMGFPRQEYQSGLSFPSPGDLPDPGIEPASSELAGRLFITEPPGKSQYQNNRRENGGLSSLKEINQDNFLKPVSTSQMERVYQILRIMTFKHQGPKIFFFYKFQERKNGIHINDQNGFRVCVCV